MCRRVLDQGQQHLYHPFVDDIVFTDPLEQSIFEELRTRREILVTIEELRGEAQRLWYDQLSAQWETAEDARAGQERNEIMEEIRVRREGLRREHDSYMWERFREHFIASEHDDEVREEFLRALRVFECWVVETGPGR